MLTALYSVGSVAGADLWMKVVLLTSLAYFLICFSFGGAEAAEECLPS